MEDQVIRLAKRNCHRPEQHQPPRASNLRQLRLNGRRIDRRSFLSAQPQQHRPIGPVPAPGERQRSIQLCPNLGHAPQHALLLQFQDEAPRRPHRPHRVRTRRPNAHLKQIEQAGLHGYRVQVAGCRLQAPRTARCAAPASYRIQGRAYNVTVDSRTTQARILFGFCRLIF